MTLNNWFARLGFQENPDYGDYRDMRDMWSRLNKYRKGTRAFSVIKSFEYWVERMNRSDRIAWERRGQEIRAMIISCHEYPNNYIRNKDKSAMINMSHIVVNKNRNRTKRKRSS